MPQIGFFQYRHLLEQGSEGRETLYRNKGYRYDAINDLFIIIYLLLNQFYTFSFNFVPTHAWNCSINGRSFLFFFFLRRTVAGRSASPPSAIGAGKTGRFTNVFRNIWKLQTAIRKKGDRQDCAVPPVVRDAFFRCFSDGRWGPDHVSRCQAPAMALGESRVMFPRCRCTCHPCLAGLKSPPEKGRKLDAFWAVHGWLCPPHPVFLLFMPCNGAWKALEYPCNIRSGFSRYETLMFHIKTKMLQAKCFQNAPDSGNPAPESSCPIRKWRPWNHPGSADESHCNPVRQTYSVFRCPPASASCLHLCYSPSDKGITFSYSCRSSALHGLVSPEIRWSLRLLCEESPILLFGGNNILSSRFRTDVETVYLCISVHL